MLKPDIDDWQGTHIKFQHRGTSASGKTHVWAVLTTDGLQLGEIKWFGRWRKYSFFPAATTVYEEVCLREIAEFIRDRTRARKLPQSVV